MLKTPIKWLRLTTLIIILGMLGLRAPSALAMSSGEVHSLSNGQRQAVGVGILEWNDKLASAAHAKANDMFAKGYWSHTSPDGLTGWDFISSSGYSYQLAGENLAKDFSNSSGVVNGWMNSPGHRANLLNGNYTQEGVAVVSGNLSGQQTTIVVALYALPTYVAPAPAPAPRPVVPAARPAVKAAPAVQQVAPSQPVEEVKSPVEVPIQTIMQAKENKPVWKLPTDWHALWELFSKKS